jgi:hypothetical protein
MKLLFKFSMVALGVAAIFFPDFLSLVDSDSLDIMQAVILFPLVGGATTTQTVQTLPQYLIIPGGLGRVTAMRVSVLGESELLNIEGSGVVALLAQYRKQSVPNYGTNNGVVVPLANGLIRGKNVQISITLSAGANLTCQGASYGRGNVYIQTLQQIVLQNSGQVFDRFAMLGVFTPNSGDTFDVSFNDGGSDRWEGNLLAQLTTMYQAQGDSNTGDDFAYIDNAGREIDKVTVIPSGSNRTVILMRYADVGGLGAAVA